MVDHQPVAARGQYARVAFPLVLVALCWLYPGRRHSDEGLLSRDLGSTFMNLNGDGDTSSKLCPQAKFRTPLFPSRSTSMTSGDSSLPPGFPQKVRHFEGHLDLSPHRCLKRREVTEEERSGCRGHWEGGVQQEKQQQQHERRRLVTAVVSLVSSVSSFLFPLVRRPSSQAIGMDVYDEYANARISKAGPIRERKIPLRLSDLQEIKRAKALNMSQSNPRRGAEEGGKADNVGEDEGDDETLISSDDDRGRIDNTDKNTKNSQQQQADKVGNTRPTSSLFPSSHSSTDASEDDNDDEEEKEEEDSKERGRRRRRKKNNDIDGRDDSSMSSDHRGQQRDHSRDAKRHRHHYRRRRRRHSSHHYTSRDGDRDYSSSSPSPRPIRRRSRYRTRRRTRRRSDREYGREDDEDDDSRSRSSSRSGRRRRRNRRRETNIHSDERGGYYPPSSRRADSRSVGGKRWRGARGQARPPLRPSKLFSEAEVVVSSSPPLPASAAAAGALPPSVDAADDSLNHNQQHQEEEDLQSRGQRRGASASPLSTTTTRTVYTNRHFSKINAAKGTSAENMEEVWNRVLGAQTFKRPKAGDSVYLSWTESTGSSLQQQQQQQ